MSNQSTSIDPLPARLAVRGALWMTGARIGTRLVNLVARTLILATLLGPKPFGIYAIGMIVLGLFDLRISLSTSLVQLRGTIEPYVPTVWTTQITQGVLLSALGYASAPWVAAIFEEPEATEVIRVLALAPLISGFASPRFVSVLRDLKFDKVFIMQVGSATTVFLCSVGYALIDPTVWALVVGYLAGVLYDVIASHLIASGNLKLGFDWAIFTKLFRFGMWVSVSAALAFAMQRVPDIYVGKAVSIVDLGVFVMAVNLATLPTLELGAVVIGVAFPAFSRIQHDPRRLSSAFAKALLLVSSAGMLITALIVTLSQDLVRLVLDERWSGVIPLMQWLAVWGACRALRSCGLSLYQGVGRPAPHAAVESVFALLLIAVGFPIATHYGASGIAAALAILGSAFQLLQLAVMIRVLDLYPRQIIEPVVGPALAGLLAGLTGFLISGALPSAGHLERAGAIAAGVGTVYLAALLTLDRMTSLGVVRAWRSLLDALPIRWER